MKNFKLDNIKNVVNTSQTEQYMMSSVSQAQKGGLVSIPSRKS